MGDTLANPWFQNIAGGLITAALLFLGSRYLVRLLLGWQTLGQFVGNGLRMKTAGVSYFIPRRTDFRHLKGGENITAYLQTTQREMIYVGFWNAKGLEHEDLRQCYKGLLERGCRIAIVMLDPDTPAPIMNGLAHHLAMSEAALRARLLESWRAMLAFRATLPHDSQSRLSLRAHSQVITASCQIIDRGHTTARALLDVKLFGQGRENTFAMELRPVAKDGLYERVVASYMSIYDSSIEKEAVELVA